MDLGDLIDETEATGAAFDVNATNDAKEIEQTTEKTVNNELKEDLQDEKTAGEHGDQSLQDNPIGSEHIEEKDKEADFGEGEERISQPIDGDQLVDENVRVQGEHEEGEQVEGKFVEGEHLHVLELDGQDIEGEHVESEHVDGEHVEGELVDGEHVDGEHVESEHVGGEHVKDEQAEGEHVEGEHAGEHAESDLVEGEHVEGEHVVAEQVEGEHVEGEHVEGEHAEGEHVEGEHVEGKVGEEMMGEEIQPEQEAKEVVEEEDEYVEPPVDPAAPYELTDSKEALRPPYVLRPDQIVELESLWELYQDHTPAYANLVNFITAKELIYMLKCLNLMTHTADQLQELIDFCVRPPHSKGHINFDQFTHICKIRFRDISAEEELRFALQVMDPEGTGILDKEYLKDILSTKGNRMGHKNLDNLIKEVDISQDGTLGIEDIVGTMAIDLNTEDLEMLRAAVYPPDKLLGHENDNETGHENKPDSPDGNKSPSEDD